MTSIFNPITEKPLSDDRAEFVRELRTVRRGARNAKRSGNPAKRAEAVRIEGMAPGMVRTVYMQDA